MDLSLHHSEPMCMQSQYHSRRPGNQGGGGRPSNQGGQQQEQNGFEHPRPGGPRPGHPHSGHQHPGHHGFGRP